jgi:hypothetical protein
MSKDYTTLEVIVLYGHELMRGDALVIRFILNYKINQMVQGV